MSRTNALSLPLTVLDIETGTNEDWAESLVYLVDSTDPIAGPQLDLRDIRFRMHVRRVPPESEVILQGSTEDGKLSVGVPPDYGFLIISVPASEMRTKIPANYVGDILAYDGVTERVIIQFNLTIIHGVTRWWADRLAEARRAAAA